MHEKLLKIATVTAAHGIGGEVRLKVFLEDKEAFENLGPFYTIGGDRIQSLRLRGKTKDQLIARLEGANNRDAAEALKGLNLFIPRSHLPEPEDADEFYVEDLKGLKVLENGQLIGIIKSVRDHGAGDLVEIEFHNGKTDFFAFTLANFPTVNVKDKQVAFVRPSEIISQDEEGKVH